MKKLFISMFYSTLLFFGATSLVAGDDINAYLTGKHVSVSDAKSKLKGAGFSVIATYAPVKNGTTLVFTCPKLKKQGAKKGRAHAAVLRMFIDDAEQTVSITNPIYFGMAFMQKDYDENVAFAVFEKISQAFPGLVGSKDKLDSGNIAGFHFMMGMPYYEDADELATANQAELLSKAKAYKKGKNLIFSLKLSSTSTLLGYELGKKTKKFIKKIGRANAAVLPYCIAVEDGTASALAAKYYLAISYPQLSMGEFMTISTVPGAIEKDLKKVFK